MNIELNVQNTNYLLEIKSQAINLRDSLYKIKTLGFRQLKDVDNIVDALSSLPIKMDLLSHFNGSLLTCNIVEEIDNSLSMLLQNANRLRGLINSQKSKIRDTIRTHEEEINSFLSNAGFKYSVRIEGEDEERILLYPRGGTGKIENVSEHLSYGEKNSLALVLFTFQTEHDGADLIILDDPISSFDGNKKFAIIHLLFMKDEHRRCRFANKTVLFLTHDFGSIIDMEYSMYRKLSCKVKSMYLYCNDNGNLAEKVILRQNIISCIEATKKVFSSEDYHIACRLSALRRYTELVDGKNNQWNYISSIIHGKEPGLLLEDGSRQPFTSDEVKEIENEIAKSITNYTHNNTIASFKDRCSLISAYENSESTYEKLQIFRVIQGNDGTTNHIVNKFINETFHVENDYLYQLEHSTYNLVPDYIIAECNKAIGLDSQV